MLWNFFLISISMENTLKNLVKIIIIGSLYKTASVDCNRQFLPPPLPYYPNGDFYVRDFGPPYHEPLPMYYREENSPPFHNINSYNPSQLFHRNENYNPLPIENPAVRYPPPQIFSYRPEFNQPYRAQPNLNNGVAQFNFKKSSQVPVMSQIRPTEATKKKPAFYSTNIIIKEESQLPYYNDDYNKNYHDEDYSDNYSDESLTQPEPCMLNSPYRYFEPPKTEPNNPNTADKYTLCSSYFQPNFGNGVYTVKMPITLLPSRFPPRVEQIIERIQNYFSTYTHQETVKPENQTLTTTTPQPTTLESQEQVDVTTENPNKRNTTEETFETNSEEANLNSTEAVITTGENNEVTQKTIVVTILPEKEEVMLSTIAPDVQDKKELLMVNQSIQTPIPITEVFIAPQGEFPVSEQQPKVAAETSPAMEVNSLSEKLPENYNLSESPIQLTNVLGLDKTTESAVMNNRTEEVFTFKEGLIQHNVTDSNG